MKRPNWLVFQKYNDQNGHFENTRIKMNHSPKCKDQNGYFKSTRTKMNQMLNRSLYLG